MKSKEEKKAMAQVFREIPIAVPKNKKEIEKIMKKLKINNPKDIVTALYNERVDRLVEILK